MSPLDRYTCEQTFERLDDYIDRELTPEEMELVRAHLDICAQCSEEFEFQENVVKAVKERLRRIDVPMESLLLRVSQALQQAQSEDPGK